MAMDGNEITIKIVENGYEVRIPDPAIVKRNAAGRGMWLDPCRTFVARTPDEALSFVRRNLDKLSTDAYGAAFAEAVSDKEEDAAEGEMDD